MFFIFIYHFSSFSMIFIFSFIFYHFLNFSSFSQFLMIFYHFLSCFYHVYITFYDFQDFSLIFMISDDFSSVFTVFASEPRSRVRRSSIPGPQPPKKLQTRKNRRTKNNSTLVLSHSRNMPMAPSWITVSSSHLLSKHSLFSAGDGILICSHLDSA